MNANSKLTRAHVKKSIQAQLSAMQRKFIPGKISGHFINSVYVARLLYYLQVTHINAEDYYRFLDVLLKGFVQRTA
jgi:hypothetical protein